MKERFPSGHRLWCLIFSSILAFALSACGGGSTGIATNATGGASSGTSPTPATPVSSTPITSTPTPTTTVPVTTTGTTPSTTPGSGATSTSGGSGSGSGAASSTPTSTTTATTTVAVGQANVTAVYMDSGPSAATTNVPNAIFADVKLCAPGSTSNCAVIDHVLVDTGSVGLRVIASAMPLALLSALPQGIQSGSVVGECVAFGSGVTWGGVRQADVRMGGSNFDGQLASNLAIQVIGDTETRVSQVPSRCSAQGAMMQTVSALGANGLLGVGLFEQDCGNACAVSVLQVYYACPTATTCAAIRMPLAAQVGNPVAAFASDNNGNTITLPALSGRSASRLDGLMVFGIGTRQNNALPVGSTVLGASAVGYFQASFNGNSLPNSFIDSGSTVNFLPPSGTTSIALCTSPYSGFLCPSTELTLTTVNMGRASTASTAQVLVINARSAFTAAPTANVFAGLAGNSSTPYDSLDLGASFFIGRSVSTLIENRFASGISITGPAFAHTP